MKAALRSVRIAPKKANLVASMIRGLTVADARASLKHTNKKAARLLEDLLNSAVANAEHNENQKVEELVVKTLVVNKAQSYHRGVPMARGRVRPMRKFLSHISITLGIAGGETKKAPKKEEKKEEGKAASAEKSTKTTSQTTKTKAQSASKSTKGTSAAKKADTAKSASASATKKS